MATALLDDLAQRINQQESELQALRRELETRHRQLVDLNQRKKDLLSQLRQIDEEIATLAGTRKRSKGKPARSQTRTLERNGAKADVRQVVFSHKARPPKVGKTQAKGKQPLSDHLLSILTAAHRPVTVPELAKEAKRRGYRTKSRIFVKNVETRCYDLQRRGLLRHPDGAPGFILA